MSEYQAQEIELTVAIPESRPWLLAARNAVRSRALPVLAGAVAAIAAEAALALLSPDNALRLAAAFAATAAWLYLGQSSRLRPALSIANVAAVAVIFALAVMGPSRPWALPAAFAAHAVWSMVLSRGSAAGLAWGTGHATLGVLLWLA